MLTKKPFKNNGLRRRGPSRPSKGPRQIFDSQARILSINRLFENQIADSRNNDYIANNRINNISFKQNAYNFFLHVATSNLELNEKYDSKSFGFLTILNFFFLARTLSKIMDSILQSSFAVCCSIKFGC